MFTNFSINNSINQLNLHKQKKSFPNKQKNTKLEEFNNYFNNKKRQSHI